METYVTPALFCGLLAIAIYDLVYLRIPDLANLALLLGGIGAGELLSRISPIWAVTSAVIAFAALWLVREGYFRWRGRHGLGLGDVKFIGASAAWVGLEGVPSVLLCAFVLGLVCVGAFVLSGRSVTLVDRWPFGPFLAAGLMLVWVVGPLDVWIGAPLLPRA